MPALLGFVLDLTSLARSGRGVQSRPAILAHETGQFVHVFSRLSASLPSASLFFLSLWTQLLGRADLFLHPLLKTPTCDDLLHI